MWLGSGWRRAALDQPERLDRFHGTGLSTAANATVGGAAGGGKAAGRRRRLSRPVRRRRRRLKAGHSV